MAQTTAYLCPEGHLRTAEAGRCPEHGTDLRPATHRCATCGYAALRSAECPTCKRPHDAVATE